VTFSGDPLDGAAASLRVPVSPGEAIFGVPYADWDRLCPGAVRLFQDPENPHIEPLVEPDP